MMKLAGTVRAVVFDLDDTLYPEMQYIKSGFRVVATRLAKEGYSAEAVYGLLWEVFEKGSRNRVFNQVLTRMGRATDDRSIAELVLAYREHRPKIWLSSPVKGALATLADHYKLGLITDGYLPAQRLKVEALELGDLFAEIIYTEELGRDYWKPACRAFEQMQAALGCGHPQCVYVADNCRKDFVAPNRLGWQSVQVKLPEGIHAQAPASVGGEPQYVVNDVAGVVRLLAALAD